MAASEVDLAFQWIQATLTGDSALAGYAPGNVWRADAPAGTPMPYVAVTYQPQPSKDEIAFGGIRVYSDLYFEVCAAGQATFLQNIVSAAGRIDTLLTIAQQTSITGGTLLASYRTAPSESDPLINGQIWNYTGGIYRIMLKAS